MTSNVDDLTSALGQASLSEERIRARANATKRVSRMRGSLSSYRHGHFIVCGGSQPGYYNLEGAAYLAANGFARAFLEEYPEEILALRALAAYVRTGEAELGRLDPIRPASSLSPSNVHPAHTTPLSPSATMPSAPPAPAIHTAPQPSTFAPATINTATVSTTSYPAPYIDPVMPTEEERSLLRSRHNGNWVWAVFIGRRPGLYFTWEAAEIQVKGVSQNDHKGFASFDEAFKAYNEKGQRGKVYVGQYAKRSAN